MEKILLIGISEEEYRKIKQVVSRLKLAVDVVEPVYYDRTLGELAGGKYKQDASGTQTSMITESLILICGLTDKRMDKLLFELRREEVSVDYKAVLTPTNKNWNVSQLLLEMRREKLAYSRQKM
uniref:DUF3783 domain-containing protein n=1 Tax=Acetatifactor sp. TaxID=1872090 RepID=UPI0040571F9E